MPTQEVAVPFLEEIADLLASEPSREQILAYRPSGAIQQRARELLERSKTGELSQDEGHELTQFEQAELLMRLVKAKVRGHRRS